MTWLQFLAFLGVTVVVSIPWPVVVRVYRMKRKRRVADARRYP